MDQWNIQSNHILSPDILCRQLGIIQTPFVGKLLCLRLCNHVQEAYIKESYHMS